MPAFDDRLKRKKKYIVTLCSRNDANSRLCDFVSRIEEKSSTWILNFPRNTAKSFLPVGKYRSIVNIYTVSLFFHTSIRDMALPTHLIDENLSLKYDFMKINAVFIA